jgi:hypothetical protein
MHLLLARYGTLEGRQLHGRIVCSVSKVWRRCLPSILSYLYNNEHACTQMYLVPEVAFNCVVMVREAHDAKSRAGCLAFSVSVDELLRARAQPTTYLPAGAAVATSPLALLPH